MTILCIETSTSVCSAAVCKDGEPVKQCICLEGSNHARLLPRYIEELLRFAAEQHLSIEAVALSEGPGSYTGLRIGTSTAKGLCYGLDVPLIPVPTLDVLVAAAKERLTLSDERSAVLIPMIDARRMEIYTRINGGTKAVVVDNEDSLTNDQLPMTNEQSVYYFGDGAEKCAKVFTKPNWHYIPGIVPEARHIASVIETSTRHLRDMNVDVAYFEPFYLKEFIAAQSHVKGLK